MQSIISIIIIIISLKLHQCDRFEDENRTTKNKALIRDPNLNQKLAQDKEGASLQESNTDRVQTHTAHTAASFSALDCDRTDGCNTASGADY